MDDRSIAYIRTEPIPPAAPCQQVSRPNYRCTIELVDGSTIIRCGFTVEHALANALECYDETVLSMSEPAQVPLAGEGQGGGEASPGSQL